MRTKAVLYALIIVLFGVAMSGCVTETEERIPLKQAESGKPNMVDERFELLSLVFRLAGRDEYSDLDTAYQEELVSVFGAFSDHPAVEYARTLPLGYDAVFNYAVHIEPEGNGFALIDDIGSLIADGRWTRGYAEGFLTVLNDFYAETDFTAFYREHIPFYEAETERFINEIYGDIDMNWFAAYGDVANMRCVVAPSSTRNNYGATVNGTIVYAAVSSFADWVIIHEFCHSFGNPIAHEWYAANPEFKKICDDTADPVLLPAYGSDGKTYAGEYVTRAYTILYFADHGRNPVPHFFNESGNGFIYIEDVYAMITEHEKTTLSDWIDWENADRIGIERSYDLGNGRIARWQYLSVPGFSTEGLMSNQYGNIFNSKTGDVMLVSIDGAEYLYIDLGAAIYRGGDVRSYMVIPVQ